MVMIWVVGGEMKNLMTWGSILPHCVGGGDLGGRRGNGEYLGLAFCRTVLERGNDLGGPS